MSAFCLLFLERMPQNDSDNRVGSRNPQAKLTEERVRAMKRLRSEARVSIRAIAAAFAVSKSTVHAILSGRKWTHV